MKNRKEMDEWMASVDAVLAEYAAATAPMNVHEETLIVPAHRRQVPDTVVNKMLGQIDS